MARGATVIVKCKRCKDPFKARVADRKRGWGKFCSKSCKAVEQTVRTGTGKPIIKETNHSNEWFLGMIERTIANMYLGDYDGNP